MTPHWLHRSYPQDLIQQSYQQHGFACSNQAACIAVQREVVILIKKKKCSFVTGLVAIFECKLNIFIFHNQTINRWEIRCRWLNAMQIFHSTIYSSFGLKKKSENSKKKWSVCHLKPKSTNELCIHVKVLLFEDEVWLCRRVKAEARVAPPPNHHITMVYVLRDRYTLTGRLHCCHPGLKTQSTPNRPIECQEVRIQTGCRSNRLISSLSHLWRSSLLCPSCCRSILTLR